MTTVIGEKLECRRLKEAEWNVLVETTEATSAGPTSPKRDRWSSAEASRPIAGPSAHCVALYFERLLKNAALSGAPEQ
jgi:hypothetical protein